jgi:hypothetical protein
VAEIWWQFLTALLAPLADLPPLQISLVATQSTVTPLLLNSPSYPHHIEPANIGDRAPRRRAHYLSAVPPCGTVWRRHSVAVGEEVTPIVDLGLGGGD